MSAQCQMNKEELMDLAEANGWIVDDAGVPGDGGKVRTQCSRRAVLVQITWDGDRPEVASRSNPYTAVDPQALAPEDLAAFLASDVEEVGGR